MKNTSQPIISGVVSASIIAASIFALAIPAFAEQISISATANSGTGLAQASINSTVVATSTVKINGHASGNATSTQNRMDAMENRGDKATADRIDSLNKLEARIQSLRNLSDDQKAALTAQIQVAIANMTNIQAKLQSDTTSAALKADLQTIAPDYRVYLLVMPQVSLLSAADRVDTLVQSLQTIQSKIQSRLTGNASLSSNTTISADLSDMSAKLSDASSLAASVKTEISGLKPDSGDATLKASNTAALKDARAKIQTAHQDLQAVRKDAGDIVKLIKGAGVNAGATTSASVQ